MTSDRSLAFILLRSCLVMVALGVVTVQTGGGLGVVGVVAFVLAAGLGGGATVLLAPAPRGQAARPLQLTRQGARPVRPGRRPWR